MASACNQDSRRRLSEIVDALLGRHWVGQPSIQSCKYAKPLSNVSCRELAPTGDG